jgi:hypothetical protein
MISLARVTSFWLFAVGQRERGYPLGIDLSFRAFLRAWRDNSIIGGWFR